MNNYDVIIIGGGLSGLSAAVELSSIGKKVLLFEQYRHCGGRAYSFIDKTTSNCVDNGQHLMMGCYKATRLYLNLIGTENLVSIQPSLQIKYLHPSYYQKIFSVKNLAAPLHLLSGLIGFNAISISDRLGMLRVAKDIFNTSPDKERTLDQITVDEWLKKLGQSDRSRKYLWDVITIGALNNHPKDVSALMLFRVLRTAFTGNRENSSLMIPRVGLSELFIEPAVRFIESHGGKVQTGIKADSLAIKNNRVQYVITNSGKKSKANSYISAVPWHAFEKIKLKGSSNNLKQGVGLQLKSSPIIAIHLWLDSEITDIDFAALLETRIQWLFNRNILANQCAAKLANARQFLSLVISGAQEFIGLTNEQLVNAAMEDLGKVLPLAKKVKVAHSIVIKEKRATFIPSPGLETLRPDTQTEFDNLFLAGDWTNTGFPATIEGAVISGKKTAEMANNYAEI